MMKRPLILAALFLTSSLGGCESRVNPFDVDPPKDCEVASQNQFVLEVMSEYYLWNDDIPVDVDLDAYESPGDVVKAVRNGNDRWTRISDKATSNALFMEGKFVGLGYKTLRGPDNEVRISFVSDDSPASAAGIVRGDVIAGVGGFTAEELDANGTWSAVYGANEPGVTVEVDILELASGEIRTVSLTKDWIDIVSLPVVEVFDGPNGAIGYFLMDRFVETTKAELDAAFASFKAAGVTTVVIDLRYNGGGLISVAERVVNLSVGAAHAGGVAYSFNYNNNYASENKSTKVSKLGASLAAEQIIVLTSSRTLSASELVINALFPYSDVKLVGSDTGGKPVGSRSFEFCEQLLFPITFRLVNAAGNTDYFDGLRADCYAADDLLHQFGDPQEGMLAAALGYAESGACEPMPTMPAPGTLLGVRRVDAVGERLLPNAEERDDIDSW
jgi:carboxyl-terminal processing protease